MICYSCKKFYSTGPCFSYINGTAQIKNGNHYLNTNIYSYLETSGSQSSNINLNVVHFLNTSVNYTSVAAEDCCFPALVSNTCCYIASFRDKNVLAFNPSNSYHLALCAQVMCLYCQPDIILLNN